ncbi:MAG: SAM-dependent methyltransferase [Clostridiales bacterium]|nr:SAM-dependent methyltransferase [Clostridiales bacterium]
MEQLRAVLEEGIGRNLYQVIMSNPRSGCEALKARIRPVLIGEKLLFQESRFISTKVFHRNLSAQETIEMILQSIRDEFKQMEMQTTDFAVTVLVSKKGKVTVKKRNSTAAGMQEKNGKGADCRTEPDGGRDIKLPDLSHNRTKKYILREDVPVGFLMDLGVQTKEGRIIRQKYDKFKQINRFLEFIEDILPILPKERTVHIIDFGCGKSYLTFAMYYYLKELKGLDIRITGLDLKEDVIRTCNALKDKYGYDGLTFLKGDISTFEGAKKVDMVVTLHACDTATDYALYKAVLWDAAVILSVPCCQHEINKQLACEELAPLFQYGLLKERMAALITDGLRANLLDQMGYDTQILEFIDMEHTPKNILIRAVKKRKKQTERAEMERLMQLLHVNPTLERLLNGESVEKAE